MIIISSNDIKIIRESSATIRKNIPMFQGEDRERLEAFCDYADKASERYEEDKEKHRLQMLKYRSDPKTAEKARKYATEAQRTYRARKKAEKAQDK
jgi:hypothetical protein